MSNYLDTMHDEFSKLREIAIMLREKSHAFYSTGNNHMGEYLEYMADDIENIEKTMSNALSADINEQFQASQQATENMVKAAMSACLDQD